MKEKFYRCSRLCRLMGNPVTFKLVVLMLQKNWLTPAQLAQRTRRSVSTVSGHLAKLRTADMVRYQGMRNQVKYRVKYKKQMQGIVDSLLKHVELASTSPADF